jgi:AcrR family transcriptional regulator
VRQTSAQIDHAIVDVAAGIFATHGYQHTSVQQIADAVGYSKPGLLHRFGSKEALYKAVLTEVDETVREVVGLAAGYGDRPDRVPGVLELVTRKALDRPGMVQMMLAAHQPGDRGPGLESVQAAGSRLVDALDRPPRGPRERLRAVLALRLIATAAVTQHSPFDASLHLDREELVPLVVGLAGQVLGPRSPS